MMASGSVFQKRGREHFEKASLLSASYTSRFILDSRHERETKKKTKENTRGTISRIHTNRKKNLNDMMREEISENEGMIHNVLIISHRFFKEQNIAFIVRYE